MRVSVGVPRRVTLRSSSEGAGDIPVQNNEYGDGKAMHISQEGRAEYITVPYAPKDVNHSALSDTWDEVQRALNYSVPMRAISPMPRMTFSLLFGYEDNNMVVAEELRLLARMARSSGRIRVDYSSWENGWWRIASLTITSQQRHPVTHEIVRANVDCEFVYAGGIEEHLGPITGGVRPPAVPLPPEDPETPAPGVVTYTVKKGDTLHKLARKFYNDTSKWKKIARDNDIRKPRKDAKLKVGKVLTIKPLKKAK